RSLRDSLFGRHERVLVLDRQGLDAATGDQLADEGVPPGLVLAPPDDREVPWHRLGRPRPAPVEEAVDGEVVSGEDDVFAMAGRGAVADFFLGGTWIHS